MFIDYSARAQKIIELFPRNEDWCDICSTTDANGIKVCPRCCLLEALANGDIAVAYELATVLEKLNA